MKSLALGSSLTLLLSIMALAGPLAGSALAVVCTQAEVTQVSATESRDPGPVGGTVTITATARNAANQVCQNVSVDYAETADTATTTPNPINDVVTNVNGEAAFVISGAAAGLTTWVVWTDQGFDNDTFDVGEANAAGNTTWQVRAVSATFTTLTPAADTNPISTAHTVTYTVRDQFNEAVVSPDVHFGVTGGNVTPTVQDTAGSAGGVATFTFTNDGTPSSNIVTACVDAVVGDDLCTGLDAATKTATKAFQAPAATTLNVTPESGSNPVGTPHVLTAIVLDQFGAAVAGANVDFNVTSGPNSNGNLLRDLDCTTGGGGLCTVPLNSTTNGIDSVCSWVDDDGDNVYNPGGLQNDGGFCVSESTAVGNDTPANLTDIVQATWTGAVGTPTRLDCTPETASNQTGQPHTVTCTVRDDNGNLVPGAQVDMEITGAGDTDAGNTPLTPDVTDTSDGSGVVTFTGTSLATGTSTFRVWIDADGNNATVEADTTEGQNEATTPGSVPEGPQGDRTDVATKTWTGAPFSISITPVTDSASLGSCNPYTVTVLDSAGTPVNGATVDASQNFDVNAVPNEAAVDFCAPPPGSGPNPITGANDDADGDSETAHDDLVATNVTGQLTFGITSNTVGAVSLRVWSDSGGDNDIFNAGEPTATASKTWNPGGGDAVAVLDAEPESASNPDGTNHTIIVTLTNTQGNAVNGVTPLSTVVAGPNAGAALSCTTSNAQGASVCEYNGDAVAASPVGTDTIRTWVNQTTGGTPGPDAGEPQDDVQKTWTARPSGLAIDLTCEGQGIGDDFDKGETGNPDANDFSDCTNPVSEETARFVAQVTNPNNPGDPFDDTPVAGQQVVFNIAVDNTASGAAFTSSGTAQAFCTTAADGSCSVQVETDTPIDNESVDVTAEIFGQVTPGNGNNSDRATKNWQTPETDSVDVTPDAATNLVLTSHTVTISATDQFGAPVAGENIDVRVTGRNTRTQNDLSTNASGEASFTYTDSGSGVSGGEDDIEAWADNSPENDVNNGEPGDFARKAWRVTVPVAANVQIDMEGCNGNTGNQLDPNWNAAANPNDVDDAHEVCATAFDGVGAPILGAEVTFTITSGPGHFTDPTGAADLGTTVTTNMGDDDRAHAVIVSAESGTTVVRATSGSVSESGSKVWNPLDPRNLDCDPETATNEPGTPHTVTCMVLDLNGNPVPAAGVTIVETGPGHYQDADCFSGSNVCTNKESGTNGVIEITVATGENETGEQTISVELNEDVGNSDAATDLDDDCDLPANFPNAGDLQGQCEDTVSKTWSQPPPPIETDHARTAHLNRFKHINLGGGRRSLKVSGTLSTDDGFAACSANQPIKVQIRAGGEWITRKSDTTNSNGNFKVLVRDIAKKYRAVAPRTQLVGDDGNLDNCLRAVSNVRRHRH